MPARHDGLRTSPWPDRLRHALLAAALFLILVGAKWATIGRFGSAMPDMDQWDAEALHTLNPWFDGRNILPDLLLAHNEHRVVLTKLQALVLTLANGQWDARLEAVSNAALHSLVIVAFWLIACRWVAARWHLPLFLTMALVFGLPIPWENILGGFHSQQYWLLGLSIAAIVTLPCARPWRLGWWTGALAASLALGTMGSGFFAAAVVFSLVTFRILRGETAWRNAWPTLVLTAALIGLGIASRVVVEGHAMLKAQSAGDFLLHARRSLAWPARGIDWAGALLWLPYALVTWRFVRSPQSLDAQSARGVPSIVALGAWVIVQILATAYVRGAHGDYPPPRYIDTLVVGMATNAVALAWLLSQKSPRVLGFTAIAWLATLLFGLGQASVRVLRSELPERARHYRAAERNLQEYLLTGNAVALSAGEIPYLGAPELIDRLDLNGIRPRLPAEIRPPLIASAALPSSAFVGLRAGAHSNDAASLAGISPLTPPFPVLPTWGSFAEQGAAATGEWRSTPLTTSLDGWLRFQLAGDAGEPEITLELQDAATGEPIKHILPDRHLGNGWRAVHARAPARPFVIVAHDNAADKWLAFTAPVEVATGSYLAWLATKGGWGICWGGVALAAGCWAFQFRRRFLTIDAS